jgi:RluA family pseudouridine synthase
MTSGTELSPQQLGPGGVVVNVAAYLFTPLDRLAERREELRSLCKTEHLKGTILLSPEGINLFVAGSRDGINSLISRLRSDPLMASLKTKESVSDRQPFRRLLVKVKKEIIAFGVPGVTPATYASKKLPAKELKRWLDEGRPVTLLDTRNDYEVRLGTFAGAQPIGIDHFRDFPVAVRKLPTELKHQTIVMFCTGGIRCEKAGPFMEQEGFQQIYQLDGGILKYFEECGGEYYDGDCFVFDQRVAVNPQLEETAATQCFACQCPLTVEDQQSEHYVYGASCPFCRKPAGGAAPVSLATRKAALAAVADPLPGAGPYMNTRPLNVPAQYDHRRLIDLLCGLHPHIPHEEWLRIIDEGLICDQRGPLTAATIVRSGQRLNRLEPNVMEPAVNAAIGILAWENDYVVFSKPAPLPMHPCGQFHRNSMTHLLSLAFPDERLSPAHRLDSNTTGVVVFSRSRQAATMIQRQFEQGTVEKTYLCRVVGQPVWDATVSRQPISSQPAAHGFRVVDEVHGDSAETAFRVLHRFPNGETLLEAMPRTGRTNQIRVHLWDLGYPIVGDPVYLAERQLGNRQTLAPTDPPMCLHAWRLAFQPIGGLSRVNYEAAPPGWAAHARHEPPEPGGVA